MVALAAGEPTIKVERYRMGAESSVHMTVPLPIVRARAWYCSANRYTAVAVGVHP
jgi:hypothetical protein